MSIVSFDISKGEQSLNSSEGFDYISMLVFINNNSNNLGALISFSIGLINRGLVLEERLFLGELNISGFVIDVEDADLDFLSNLS